MRIHPSVSERSIWNLCMTGRSYFRRELIDNFFLTWTFILQQKLFRWNTTFFVLISSHVKTFVRSWSDRSSGKYQFYFSVCWLWRRRSLASCRIFVTAPNLRICLLRYFQLSAITEKTWQTNMMHFLNWKCPHCATRRGKVSRSCLLLCTLHFLWESNELFASKLSCGKRCVSLNFQLTSFIFKTSWRNSKSDLGENDVKSRLRTTRSTFFYEVRQKEL